MSWPPRRFEDMDCPRIRNAQPQERQAHLCSTVSSSVSPRVAPILQPVVEVSSAPMTAPAAIWIKCLPPDALVSDSNAPLNPPDTAPIAAPAIAPNTPPTRWAVYRGTVLTDLQMGQGCAVPWYSWFIGQPTCEVSKAGDDCLHINKRRLMFQR